MAFSITRPLSRGAALAACMAAILISACDNARPQQAHSWVPANSVSVSPFVIGTNVRIVTDDGRRYDPAFGDLLTAVAGEGYSSVRFEWGLAGVERRPGSGDISGRLANSSPVRPLVILTGGGSARFTGGMPLTEQDIAAYRDFAIQSADAFGPEPIFEVWNEWNLKTRLRPAGEVSTYIDLARTTYQALKTQNKDAVVLVGVLGNEIGSGPFQQDRLAWLESAISQGLLETSDGLSIHLYNNCDQYRSASVADMLWRVEQTHQMILKKIGKSHPIYITEVGWPSRPSPASKCGYSPEDSATHAARFLLATSAMPDVRGVWLYEYSDRAAAEGLEGHFGLRTSHGENKAPACDLLKIKEIIRSSTRRSLNVTDGVYYFQGSNDRDQWDIYWSETESESEPKAQPLPQGAQEVSEVCGTGRPLRDRAEVTGNHLIIKLR
jgi:hypothetical protein